MHYWLLAVFPCSVWQMVSGLVCSSWTRSWVLMIEWCKMCPDNGVIAKELGMNINLLLKINRHYLHRLGFSLWFLQRSGCTVVVGVHLSSLRGVFDEDVLSTAGTTLRRYLSLTGQLTRVVITTSIYDSLTVLLSTNMFLRRNSSDAYCCDNVDCSSLYLSCSWSREHLAEVWIISRSEMLLIRWIILNKNAVLNEEWSGDPGMWRNTRSGENKLWSYGMNFRIDCIVLSQSEETKCSLTYALSFFKPSCKTSVSQT